MAGSSSPKFLKPISGRTLGQSGGRAVLEAVVVGRPLPVVTWHRNGLPVTKDERHLMRYEERGNCCLTLLNVGGDDEGEYECRARNRLGQVSCFGQLYVNDSHGLESGVKQMGLRQPSSHASSRTDTQHQQTTDGEDGNDESEGHSGLFILIDEGSQDENSADEMGRKESISASEQIESIIEDLRLRDGSLNFSLAKQGSCSSEQRSHHPSSTSLKETSSTLSKDQQQQQRTSSSSTSSSSTSGGNKPINFKENCEQRKRFLNNPDMEFEDSVVLGDDIPITSRGRKSPKCLARHSNPIRHRVTVPLHKVVGVEDNLHRAFDDGSGGSSTSDSTEANLHFAPLADYEMIRSANISEDSLRFRHRFPYRAEDLDGEDQVVNISPPPEFQTKSKLDERRNKSEASCRGSKPKSHVQASRHRSVSDCHDRLQCRGNDDSASSPWESSEEVFEESLELESSVEEVFPAFALDPEDSATLPRSVDEEVVAEA